MTSNFNFLLAALVTVLFIIIFCLYQREQSAARKLRRADKVIAEIEDELSIVTTGVCSQETDLGKCRGDLATIQNKSAESETAIASLTADIQETREKLSKAEEELKLYKHLTFELKRAVDNAPCGFGVVRPAHDEDSARLLTRLDDQRHLIQQLRGQLLDREARISGLLARSYMQSGMY